MNPAAFESTIRRIAASFARNRDELEEFAQIGRIKAFEILSQKQHAGLVCRSVANAIKDEIGKLSVRARYSTPLHDASIVRDDSEEIVDRLLNQETARILLEQMTAEEQNMVFLHIEHGGNRKVLAPLFGVSESAYRSRIERLRNRLRSAA